MQLLNCMKNMGLVISFYISCYSVVACDDCLMDHLIKKGYFNNPCNFFALYLNYLQVGPFPKPAIQQKISVSC